MTEVKSFINTFVPEENGLKFKNIELKNIISGDTDSVYATLSGIFDKNEKDHELINTVANHIAERVNEEFPSFMKEIFNVTENESKLIKTEKEVLGDSAFLLTKKRYIIHVINNENEWVDKYKIMGMEIIKSDTPVVVKDFLFNLSLSIMNMTSEKDLRNMVNDFKSKYFKMNIIDIGTPSNTKVLYKYNEIYRKTNSLKGCPNHIKGSIFYNSLCSKNDPIIFPGTKVKVSYINHPDSNTIAVPIDAEELPAFMNDIVIDYSKMWEKKVVKKIDNYLTNANMDYRADNVTTKSNVSLITFG